MGKGWVSNLHSCVSEDAQTHDLTYITGTGAKIVFEYDSQTSSYTNPNSFTGIAIENQDGTYTIQTLDGQIATFSSNGKLASLSSLAGGLLEVGYDGSGRPETLTDNKSSTRDHPYVGRERRSHPSRRYNRQCLVILL